MSRTVTINELIADLDRIIDKHGKDVPVYYSDGAAIHENTYLGSWRGIYQNFALGHGHPSHHSTTVEKLRDRLRQSVGTILYGYKGGDYDSGGDTPIWRDNYSEYTDTAIVGVTYSSTTERAVILVDEND